MRALLESFRNNSLNGITFLIVNSAESAQEFDALVYSAGIIPVYQESENSIISDSLHAKKDDVFIFDRCGRISFYLPFPLNQMNGAYVESALLATYYDTPCGLCDRQEPKEQATVPGELLVPVKECIAGNSTPGSDLLCHVVIVEVGGGAMVNGTNDDNTSTVGNILEAELNNTNAGNATSNGVSRGGDQSHHMSGGVSEGVSSTVDLDSAIELNSTETHVALDPINVAHIQTNDINNEHKNHSVSENKTKHLTIEQEESIFSTLRLHLGTSFHVKGQTDTLEEDKLEPIFSEESVDNESLVHKNKTSANSEEENEASKEKDEVANSLLSINKTETVDPLLTFNKLLCRRPEMQITLKHLYQWFHKQTAPENHCSKSTLGELESITLETTEESVAILESDSENRTREIAKENPVLNPILENNGLLKEQIDLESTEMGVDNNGDDTLYTCPDYNRNRCDEMQSKFMRARRCCHLIAKSEIKEQGTQVRKCKGISRGWCTKMKTVSKCCQQETERYSKHKSKKEKVGKERIVDEIRFSNGSAVTEKPEQNSRKL